MTNGGNRGVNDLPFRRLRSEAVPLTPALAQEFHDMEASPTERELSTARVRHLTEKIKAGLAVSFHWAAAELVEPATETRAERRRKLRMNGNHSSGALVGLNGAFPEGLIAHIDEYEVGEPAGLALLFRQFDDKKSARSSKDVCGAYQGLYDELKTVPRDTAKLAVEGVSWHRQFIENQQGLPTARGDDVGILFGETPLHPFIQFLGTLFTIKTPELRKASIVAAIFETFIKDEQDAKDFWLETARGGKDYEPKAPSTVLDTELKGFAEAKAGNESMKPLNYFGGSIYAWNAYRKGRPLDASNWDVKKSIPRAA